MKWNLFSKDKSPAKELKKKNELLRRQLVSEPSGAFKKSSIFFKNLFFGLKFNEDVKNQVEELLLGLDFGPFLSDHLSVRVASKLLDSKVSSDNVKNVFSQELLSFYGDSSCELNAQKGRVNVFLIVGINGSGKTTSIAKLAHKFKTEGFRVLIVAGDTFRAGAVEQLKKWADAMEIDIFLPQKHKEDPSALIYKVLSSIASSGDYDVVICDTSGRQHNNNNLLQELNKVYKTMQRFNEQFPHEILLVIDSTLGQVSLLQVEKFQQYVPVTGIILSKMDNMLKGGIIFSIKERLKVPVKLVGTGEDMDSLRKFNLPEIVNSWMSNLENS